MSQEELFKIISEQTGEKDLLVVEKTYYECNSNEIDTIFKLMNISPPIKKEKPRTVFDDLREICDEKDYIFQQIMKKE